MTSRNSVQSGLSVVDIGKDVFYLVGCDAGGEAHSSEEDQTAGGGDNVRETTALPRRHGGLEIDALSDRTMCYQRLKSIPGIGPIISTAVVSSIGTDEARKQGLRTLFIQSAAVLLLSSHNWQKFSFCSWLERAAGRLHKNKLAVVLANELARIAWIESIARALPRRIESALSFRMLSADLMRFIPNQQSREGSCRGLTVGFT